MYRLSAYLLLVCSTVVVAQNATELDTIVVTGTLSQKKLKDVPVRTEVITREVIQKEHARDAKEVLRYAAGVLLKPVHGKTGSEAWLQGLDGNRVLVLINGERVSASTGSTVDLTQIGVADIKQVEIVKGAASALHGSSAMGGVINIITREPEQGWHGKISGDIGSYGEYDRAGERRPAAIYGRAALSYRNNNMDFSLDADQRDSDGFLIPAARPSSDINGQDGYKRNINTRLAYRPSEQLELKAAYREYREDHVQHNIVDIAGRGLRSLPRTETVDTEHYSFGLEYQKDNADRLKFKAYLEDFNNQTFSRELRLADITTNGAEIQYDVNFDNDSILTSGLVYNEETLNQLQGGVSELQGGKRQRDSHELFLQYDYWLTDNVEILPGLRYQDDSDFGEHTAPKLSAMISHQAAAGEGRVRISYGNGYRVPNMKERHFRFDHSAIGYMVMGNPKLQPEESTSYQMGYEWHDQDSWGADLNAFYNDIDDLIETAFEEVQIIDGRPVNIFRYGNLEKARTQGLELGGYKAFSELVKLKASYTYLQAENKTAGANRGKRLALRPENLFKLNLDWKLFDGKGDFLIRYVYTGKEFIDGANTRISPQSHLWDLKYTHQLNQYISVYGGVDNIGNVHRELGSSNDQRSVPGRFTYVGGSLSF